MTFRIKNLTFENVMLAPMAGVTDAPFRSMVRRFGNELVFSEMVLAESLVRGHDKTTRMADRTGRDAPFAVQIVGRDPAVMADAAVIAEKQGAFVDINMGCPVPKIVKAGEGSALMEDEDRAERIVRAVSDAVRCPVTVKFRLGVDDERRNYVDFGKRMRDAGASALILHARTRRQMYSGSADIRGFAALKEAVDVPVVANGDIRTAADAARVFERTGADAVMVGRGALGRPWALAEVAGRNPMPGGATADFVLDHLEALEKYYGRNAIFIARKHIAWYSLGRQGGAAFRERVNTEGDPAAVKEMIGSFFGTDDG